MPYPSFKQSAECLDYRRLGKQRVECLQLLKALQIGPYICSECREPYPNDPCCGGMGIPIKTPWYNHPAVQQWKGYEIALMEYLYAMCHEWTANRGYKDTCWVKAIEVGPSPANVGVKTKMPPWLGNERFHSSHRAALLLKNPHWYQRFGWKESPCINYVWPTKNLV